jgi:kinetochore protein Mis13/DSN1
VPSTSFYKHLPIDQPEPIKARWLISWCAKRALDEQLANSSKGKAKAEQSEEIDRLLSDVVEDFVSNVAKGNVDTNVFGERVS